MTVMKTGNRDENRQVITERQNRDAKSCPRRKASTWAYKTYFGTENSRRWKVPRIRNCHQLGTRLRQKNCRLKMNVNI